jgi:hypothetical protein
VVLKEGDGVYVNANGSPEVEVNFTNGGDKVAEVLVFDLE